MSNPSMTTPNAPADAAEPRKPGGLNGRVVLHAVRRRPVVFVGVVALSAVAAAAVWFFLPLPKVTAAVVFHVASHTPTLLTPTAQSDGVPFASYKLSQASLVKSRLTINNALKQPGVNGLGVVRTADPDAITWLDKKLVVDSKNTSEFMRVTLEGEDGEELTAVLQAVSKAYLASVDDRDNGGRKRKLAKLEESQRAYRTEVERFQGQINKIAISLGSTDGPTLSAVEQGHKEDLRAATRDLATARDDYQLAERELAGWDAANAPKPGEPAPPPVAVPEAAIEQEFRQDKVLQDLEAEIGRATQVLLKAEKEFEADAPAVVRAREKVQEAEAKRDKYRADRRTAIEARLRDVHRQAEKGRRDALQNKAAGLGQRVQIAEDRVKEVKRKIEEFSAHRLELENYKRLSEQNEKLSSQMSGEIERLKVELGAPSRVTTSEEPYVINGLEGNRRLKFTIMAGIGVFVLGFVGLVGWEARGRRVTHADEVTTALGVRLLGTVPPVANSDGPQAAQTRAALVEAIDTTRTMLLHGSPGGKTLRTVLVTSGVSGEGKTALSGHLAISLARAGFKTLLVDGDLHSPSAHRLFDLPASPGLCELLRDEIGTHAAVRPTPLPGLSVLPAGSVDTSARQALVGPRWREIRQGLEAQFDFVVIDTAPLLLVADTLLLAREADGVVLSVLLGVSQVGHVAETAARLRAIGANLTGAVVNGVWHEAYRASNRYGADAASGRPSEPAPAPVPAAAALVENKE